MIIEFPLIAIVVLQMLAAKYLLNISVFERRWTSISLIAFMLVVTIVLWSPPDLLFAILENQISLEPSTLVLTSVLELVLLAILLTISNRDIDSNSLPWLFLVSAWEIFALLALKPAESLAAIVISTTLITIHIWKSSKTLRYYLLVVIGLLAANLVTLLFEMEAWGAQLPDWMLITMGLAVFIRLGIFPFSSGLNALLHRKQFSLQSLVVMMPLSGVTLFYLLHEPLTAHMEISNAFTIFLAVVAPISVAMSLIQTDVSRVLSYILIGMQSILLLAIIQAELPVAIYLLWISFLGASMGISCVVHILQLRVGNISLKHYNGLYGFSPQLSLFFLVLGGAYAAFPSFLGFIALDIFLHSMRSHSFWLMLSMVSSVALTGFSLFRLYFRIFFGKEWKKDTVITLKNREIWGLFLLCSALIISGLLPQILPMF